MAICAINPDAMTPLLDRVAAKMPVVVHDSDAPKSKRKAFVGTNNVEAGRLAGQAAIAALEGAGITKGKVAMFVGRIDMQNSIDRKAGIDETLGKRAGIEIPHPVRAHLEPVRDAVEAREGGGFRVRGLRQRGDEDRPPVG